MPKSKGGKNNNGSENIIYLTTYCPQSGKSTGRGPAVRSPPPSSWQSEKNATPVRKSR